jgi:CDP-diacylglycerol--glycerol-3-phosphate 3-phosphatidyltransferase
MDLGNWKEAARARLRPLVLTLDGWGFSPLAVTIAGTVVALLGAWMVAEGLLFLGTLVFLIGSAFDMLDGALARLQGTVSRRGAFLDSVLDRFGEAGYLTGVAIWWMSRQPDDWMRAVILILVTFFGSMATSYVRARAEGLGETCTVGVLQRTERVIILGLGGLLGHVVLMGALWILAVATMVTTLQRIVHVASRLPGPPPPEERTPEPQPEPQPPADPGPWARPEEPPADAPPAPAGADAPAGSDDPPGPDEPQDRWRQAEPPADTAEPAGEDAATDDGPASPDDAGDGDHDVPRDPWGRP